MKSILLEAVAFLLVGVVSYDESCAQQWFYRPITGNYVYKPRTCIGPSCRQVHTPAYTYRRPVQTVERVEYVTRQPVSRAPRVQSNANSGSRSRGSRRSQGSSGLERPETSRLEKFETENASPDSTTAKMRELNARLDALVSNTERRRKESGSPAAKKPSLTSFKNIASIDEARIGQLAQRMFDISTEQEDLEYQLRREIRRQEKARKMLEFLREFSKNEP